ncbi:hypothetical protein [Deinococcus soli (ex Cha et al. 2016)]
MAANLCFGPTDEMELTRMMAGAEVLGTAKGPSAVQAFLDLVDAECQPLN